MDERTSLRSATLESMIALATRVAYLSCFSCSTGSPLLMIGPPKVIQSRKSLKDSILVVSARMVRRIWCPVSASVSPSLAVSSTRPKTAISASSISRCLSWSVLSFSFAAAWVFLTRRRSISINSSRQFDRVCWSRPRSSVCRLPGRLIPRRSLTSRAHFQGSGFGGELPELGVGNALQHRVWVNEAGQPAEPIRPQSDRLWASRARCLFEAVEARGHDARLDDQQSIQGRDIVRLQSGSDLVVHPRVDLSTQMVRQPLERAEGWQVSGGFAQRLDRSVDQVGRITHRRGRLEHGGRDQLFTGRGVNRDIEIGTHRRTVMVERRLSTGLIQKWRYGGQHELRCQMRHGIAMNVQRCRETTEILAHLQKRRQRQAAGVAPGSGADEGVVGFAQAVADTQFLARQSFTRTRVGGAVYRCHKVSEKGFAGAAEGDE